jgi:hypothetical protein
MERSQKTKSHQTRHNGVILLGGNQTLGLRQPVAQKLQVLTSHWVPLSSEGGSVPALHQGTCVPFPKTPQEEGQRAKAERRSDVAHFMLLFSS